MPTKLLVVDDEPNIVATLSEILTEEGYAVVSAARGDAVLEQVELEQPDLVLLDVMLPGLSGLEVLSRIKKNHAGLEVIMISGHATVDRAVEAIRNGAYDFLEKPLSLKRVLLTVSRALERRNLTRDRTARRVAEHSRHEILGDSDLTERLREQIRQVAPTSARVLVTGETGTGKELVAYWLHHLSPRNEQPFIKINCAAIPKELLESELFGHEKGAFTGAHAAKPGKFRLADKGTVLLDEIGDMDPLLQAKLLRVLESGEFEPLGSNTPVHVDVRVVAATNQDLAEGIHNGRFREDLYHRLNVFHIHVPALRERPEDIPGLARCFLDRHCTENGLPPKQLTPGAIAHLQHQSLPGNVRELKNLVERAAIVTPGSSITESGFSTGTLAVSRNDQFTTTRPLAQARNELEKTFLETQLAQFQWNITRAADALSVERSNLSRRLKQLGINRPEPYS